LSIFRAANYKTRSLDEQPVYQKRWKESQGAIPNHDNLS